GTLLAGELADLGQQLAMGLSHLHSLGMLYGSLAASGVLRGSLDGLWKLGDFSRAAALPVAASEWRSRSGAKPCEAPPEARGSTDDALKPEADVWLLASLVLATLCAAKPGDAFFALAPERLLDSAVARVWLLLQWLLAEDGKCRAAPLRSWRIFLWKGCGTLLGLRLTRSWKTAASTVMESGVLRRLLGTSPADIRSYLQAFAKRALVEMWLTFPPMRVACQLKVDRSTLLALVATMAMTVTVSLMSGRSAKLKAEPGSRVHDLRTRASKELKAPIGGLVLQMQGAPNTTPLDEEATLQQAGVRDGAMLNATVKQVPVGCSRRNAAFALVRGDGTVVTWGDAQSGGDSSSVYKGLTKVQTIKATSRAFAALKRDGQVVTWGDPLRGGRGGPSSHLMDVRSLQASQSAFAALRNDGRVVTWGDTAAGADSNSVSQRLLEVSSISATAFALAAICQDGLVETWGDRRYGGDCRAVQKELQSVRSIVGNDFAFAAIRADGSVVCWGKDDSGGSTGEMQAQLIDVVSIEASSAAFAAIRSDGRVVAWGDRQFGGDCSSVRDQLIQVQSITASRAAFAALKADNTVVVWGHEQYGGTVSLQISPQLNHVNLIKATEFAFAALKSDGQVVTWGNPVEGGDSQSPSVKEKLRDVQQIEASSGAFLAIRADGSVVCWGNSDKGAYTKPVDMYLKDVHCIGTRYETCWFQHVLRRRRFKLGATKESEESRFEAEGAFFGRVVGFASAGEAKWQMIRLARHLSICLACAVSLAETVLLVVLAALVVLERPAGRSSGTGAYNFAGYVGRHRQAGVARRCEFQQKREALKECLAREYRSFFRPFEAEYYDEDVSFKDPLNNLAGKDSYKANVEMLSGDSFVGNLLFSDGFIDLHAVEEVPGQPTRLRTRWTLGFVFKLLPWKPRALFSGVSEYEIDGQSAKVWTTSSRCPESELIRRTRAHLHQLPRRGEDALRGQGERGDLIFGEVANTPGPGVPEPPLSGLKDLVSQLLPGALKPAEAREPAVAEEAGWELLRRAAAYRIYRSSDGRIFAVPAPSFTAGLAGVKAEMEAHGLKAGQVREVNGVQSLELAEPSPWVSAEAVLQAS
ncbi:unnamed protein product, partial [Symbiodinium necroappetens]